MNHSLIVITSTCVLLLCGQAVNAAWDTVILRDDFDTPGPPDAAKWVRNHPPHTWWTQGRTHFPDPLTTSGYLPYVESGACVIEHHHYNPYDLGDPNEWFLGGEIHTVMELDLSSAYRFEARVRGGPYPDGLVTSFFVYGWDDVNEDSDEIDFEFVSNKTNDDVTYPNGDPVLTNTWNDSNQKPMYVPPAVPPDGLDLADWNTFIIYWFPSLHRVDWAWISTVSGEEELLRTETDAFFIPNEPMSLYFNFWAPSINWADAYSAALQPVNELGLDVTFKYEIDYAEVRVPEPVTSTFLVPGGALLLARRRRMGRITPASR